MNHEEPSSEIELDRLSSLSGHIIDKILSQLPICDAVRTSVLSTNWRYNWATLSSLVFDVNDQLIIKSKLVNIVDYVLLLYIGPICKFKLSLPYLIDVTNIERWILHLSRSPIREFVLQIWKGQRYKLHSCLFSCQNLTHLELLRCILKPPPSFQGFKNLKSLHLEKVTMEQDVFNNLISSCPLLERLTLMKFDYFGHLNIDAPNLVFLHIEGVFDCITFTNILQLPLVTIDLHVGDIAKWPRSNNNLLKFFIHLSHIQSLKIRGYFLKYLAFGDGPSRLPNPCVDLGYLSIDINFDDWEENEAAFCLLRNSPNLQELEILCNAEEGSLVGSYASFWKGEDMSCLFNQLQIVEVKNISGTRLELELISFLLSASPVLKRMTIRPASAHGGLSMTKELLRFRRASARAKVDYLDTVLS